MAGRWSSPFATPTAGAAVTRGSRLCLCVCVCVMHVFGSEMGQLPISTLRCVTCVHPQPIGQMCTRDAHLTNSPTTHWSNVHKRCTFDQWVVGEHNAQLGVRTQLTQIRTLCACLCPASPSWSTQPAASCSKQWVRRRREGVTRRGGGA